MNRLKTEYLITIDKKKGIGTDATSFKYLLMSNPKIKISTKTIEYESNEYPYVIQKYNIDSTDFICYQITIECIESNLSLNDTMILNYQKLLKDIRTIIFKYTTDIEVLWDDISFTCSQMAYPIIYEIENLMRKLLTKFMLINVGTKWEKENIPSKISKSKNANKEINLGNGLLYQLDFIELSTFLFDPYSRKSNINDLKKDVDLKKDIPYTLLEDFIAKSNWERYFNNFVSVENEHLKKKWSELYELRCKIAHNNMFTFQDYNIVQSIVNELKPSLEKAIIELDKIIIDEKSKESVSESFARTTNEQVGILIFEHNKLLRIIGEYQNSISGIQIDVTKKSLQMLASDLYNKNLIDESVHKELKMISYNRNKIVHHGPNDIHDYDIPDIISKISDLITYFEQKIQENQ